MGSLGTGKHLKAHNGIRARRECRLAHPGLCFRMVYSNFNGYPTRCPVTPGWRGTFVNPKGERWPVEACEEHVDDVHRPRRR
jgi:hypothetical protein